jgi:hypothetical protein
MQNSQYHISSNSLITVGNEAGKTSYYYYKIKQFSKNIQPTKHIFPKTYNWQISPVGRPTETYRCLPSIHTIKQSAVFHPTGEKLNSATVKCSFGNFLKRFSCLPERPWARLLPSIIETFLELYSTSRDKSVQNAIETGPTLHA